MNLTPQQRVANGIQLLNEKVPGWIDKINLEKLNILHYWNCVLGQVIGGYNEGLRKFGLTQQEGIQHGFFADNVEHATLYERDAQLLTEEWKKAVRLARGESVTITQQ